MQENPDEKKIAIKEAKKLLQENNYIVIKMTEQMDRDANECEASNGSKDCSECSCNLCVIQA